jgi:uncharacterized protein YuzE
MKLTINKRLNVGYIQFKKTKISKTLKVTQSLLIDIGKDGEIVGIELLEVAGTPKMMKVRSAGRSASQRTRKKAA